MTCLVGKRSSYNTNTALVKLRQLLLYKEWLSTFVVVALWKFKYV